MKIIKNLSFVIALSLPYISAVADNNPSNNNSATQFKTGNRNASIGLESAFYNPAGTVLGKDGFYLEFSLLPSKSGQSVYDQGLDKTYESKTTSLLYPALNLLYKKNKFSFYSNIGITNGGGTGNYDNGLPMYDYTGYLQGATAVAALITAGSLTSSVDPYSVESTSSFNGSAYGIGGSVGVAYKFNHWLSAAFAVQYSHQTNHTEGYLNVTHPSLGELSTTEIDFDETGSNMGFIFGLDIKPVKKMLIAQTFRYYTELEMTTKINDDKDGGLYTDGDKSLNTYVPYYSLGISYDLSGKLRMEADMNLSLYCMLDNTDSSGSNSADNYNNGIDIGLGAEYQITDKINYGLGFTYSPAKMKKEEMSETEFENNSLWLDTGATVKITKNMSANLAFQLGVPMEEVKMDVNYEDVIDTKQTYKNKVSYAMGIGVAYKF